MSLRVMALIGCLLLVLGFMMLWFVPAPPSRTMSVKPIGTSAVSHGGSASAGQSKSRMDPPGSIGSREEADTPRR